VGRSGRETIVPTPLTHMLPRQRPPRRVRLRGVYRLGVAFVSFLIVLAALAGVAIANHALEPPLSPAHVVVAIAWNLGVLGAIAFVVGSMWWAWRLARWGAVAEGVVTGRRTLRVARGQRTAYLVSYEFRLSDGWYRRGEAAFERDRYDELVEGEPLTILYDPAYPETHVVYERAPYEVEGVIIPRRAPRKA
jgi:hypothetical protein